MIKTEALTRTYETVKAVDNVSFEIAHGQIVGLLGHNGAGKTTIMKMITGFIEPSSGSIEIDGLKIDSDREQIQKKIGYLPENCPLYPEMNVIDFLDYAANLKGLSETKKTDAIRTAIHKTNLGTVAEKQVNTLSRGYRQRLGVAQAILNEPKILILDEPTNGLDPSQIQEMRNLIKDLARNATLVISTHILQEVQATCDRVIIIKKGVVAVDASMTELSTANRLEIILNVSADKAEPALMEIDGIESIEASEKDGLFQYTLHIANNFQTADLSPGIARKIIESGFELYGLKQSGQDLETIFGEISKSESYKVDDSQNG